MPVLAALALFAAPFAQAKKTAMLYVGSVECGAKDLRALGNPSPGTMKNAAERAGFKSLQIEGVVVVWNEQDPLLASLLGGHRTFSKMAAEVEKGKSLSFNIDSLGDDGSASLIAGLPFNVSAMPGAKICLNPMYRARVSDSGRMEAIRGQFAESQAGSGFISNPTPKDTISNGVFYGFQNRRYQRSVEHISGSLAESKKANGKALETFDRVVEQLRAQVVSSFLSLHNTLMLTGGFAEMASQSGSFESLPQMLKGTILGELKQNHSRYGFGSAENAERFLRDAPKFELLPTISFGISYLTAEGGISQGFYEVTVPARKG